MVIPSSLRVLLSKIWFDSVPKFSIIGYSLHIEIIVKILFTFSSKLNAKISLSFTGKEISDTIIFPIIVKKTSPRHTSFSEFFIHEGILVTSNMFFLYWAMNIKQFQGNLFNFFKFTRLDILKRKLLKKTCSKWYIMKVTEISILNDFRFILHVKNP